MRGILNVSLILLLVLLGLGYFATAIKACYALGGIVAVIVGLVLAGAGVVPVAMILAIIKGQWIIFFSLAFWLAVILGIYYAIGFTVLRRHS